MMRLLNDQEKTPEFSSLAGQTGMTKEAVAAFFDRLAPHWDEDLVVDPDKINCILDAAGVTAGSKVLDVACGTGVLFPFYASRDAAQVTAVDLSPGMVKIASEKTQDPRFQIICADIESLSATGDFDCCVVYNAFPHFPDPARLIQKLSGFLKPGGRLTIAHGMSLEAVNRHHSGSASKVSRGLLPAQKLAELFEKRFLADLVLSDSEKYIVSGSLPSKREDRRK